MIKKPLLAYKIPYVGKDIDVTTVLNYMAKVLNSTFRDNVDDLIKTAIENNTDVFVDFSFSLANLGTVTLNHNLNVIPTGWIIIDHTEPNFAGSYLVRLSWSTTQITVGNFNLNTAGTANYKIRVFI